MRRRNAEERQDNHAQHQRDARRASQNEPRENRVPTDRSDLLLGERHGFSVAAEGASSSGELRQCVNRVERAHPALIGGTGIYPGTSAHGPFIHIDTRGFRARWLGSGDD